MFAAPQDDGMGYTHTTDSNISLLDDEGGDDREGLLGGSSSAATNDGTNSAGRRVERHMTLRERLESLKQQASERFTAMTNAPAAAAGSEVEVRFSYADVQKAVDDTIEKLTDTLYRDLDYEKALVFVDDVKSWSGGMPTMLPIVVSCIDKRLRNEDPNITFLTLCLIDTLVKNSSLNFHRCVATQPVMSTVARIARGSAHNSITKYSGDLRKDAGALWNSLAGKKPEPAEKAARERGCRAATTKAKEVAKVWGEGFVSTASAVPLFAETYQTLLNEGMIFPDVQGGIVLDAPDEFAIVGADGTAHLSADGGNTPDMSELSESAHQTAKLLSEVCSHDTSGQDEAGLVQLLADQCKAQQVQLASVIEIAMATNDEPQLISALAANEALQEALAANGERAGKSGGSSSTGAIPSDFENVMGDVDDLLFADDGLDMGVPSVATAASASDGTIDLLDLDFLTPAAPPAPPVCPPPATAAPIAPPPMPPPVPTTIPAIPAAPLAPPPAFQASAVDDVEDGFSGLVLQRKQKNQLQEL